MSPRKYNNIVMNRVVGAINLQIARRLVKPIRASGYRARIDTYKGKFAIWAYKYNSKRSISDGFMRESDYHKKIFNSGDYKHLIGADWKTTMATKSRVNVRIPIGTWRYDDKSRMKYGYDVEVLLLFNPKRLVPFEGRYVGKRRYIPELGKEQYIDIYEKWIKAGSIPPPIEVIKIHNSSKLRIVNGHRRWAAAIGTNTKIRAWVSYTMIGDLDIPVSLAVRL